MRIVLAPMEGLADVYLRRLLTAQGGFDWAVSEFVRVVDRPYPDRYFLSHCPELADGGTTDSGTPIRVQLLGNDLEAMATNAQTAIRLGSFGLDINFGCPSKTVNRRQGGAVLLQNPNELYNVVHAVRQALPGSVTVSAKMRLGYDDNGLMIENACAIESAGATELTVHARTKAQGYRPPAHWHELATIRKHLTIPVIANGDVWSNKDYQACVEASGITDVMLGRGAVRNPALANQIRTSKESLSDWPSIQRLLLQFWKDIHATLPDKQRVGRVKQWLNHLRIVHPDAESLWRVIRSETCPQTIERALNTPYCDQISSAIEC